MIGQRLLITAIVVFVTFIGGYFLYSAIKNYRNERLYLACWDTMITLYWVAYMFKLVFEL